MKNYAVLLAVGLVLSGIFYLKRQQTDIPYAPPPIAWEQPAVPIVPQKPETPNITNPIPSYQNYGEIYTQLQEWAKQAPNLTETGDIGKSTAGMPIVFIRVTNKLNQTEKPKILITACIHGNEPHATSVTMGYIGTLLSKYGQDSEITDLLDNRDIYFIPVLSPDSYPKSRHVDGVDPNRDYTNRKSAPVRMVQEFFLKHNFDAVMSGHTWGRVYLTPWGGKMDNCPHDAEYKRIIGHMSTLSGYRNMRACDLYQGNGTLNNPPIRSWIGSGEDYGMIPIYGAEMDWYYTHGEKNGRKKGAFAIVCEYGTHQRLPTKAEIDSEFNTTWKGFIHFCKEGPLVQIWWD